MFIVYGRNKPVCPYCESAKKLLKSKGRDFTYIDIVETKMSKAELEEKVGRPVRTVPIIMNGAEFVGGFVDLQCFLGVEA